ncbi:MAG: transposase [Proteobacteria bacterium]|nr:transposase [Pseudomonadota bacterium]
MPYYAQEFKEKTTRQLLPPHSRSVASVSRETGVSEPTLYAWKKQFGQQAQPAAPQGSSRSWNAKARLGAVIATAAMNETERSAWCREQGLYVHELDAWRQAFEGMDDDKAHASRSNMAQQRKSLAKLQKEIERKDKALAEAGLDPFPRTGIGLILKPSQAYRLLPSLREYLLLHQDCVQANLYQLGDEGRWQHKVFSQPDKVLALRCLDAQVTLRDVYADVPELLA